MKCSLRNISLPDAELEQISSAVTACHSVNKKPFEQVKSPFICSPVLYSSNKISGSYQSWLFLLLLLDYEKRSWWSQQSHGAALLFGDRALIRKDLSAGQISCGVLPALLFATLLGAAKFRKAFKIHRQAPGAIDLVKWVRVGRQQTKESWEESKKRLGPIYRRAWKHEIFVSGNVI